ncbi:MAG: cytochrome-c oxidase, cbb3-type subunit I [Polyangiaceae bacterium]
MTTHVEKFSYDDATVRKFVFATAIWGLVATLAGLWLALMLVMPSLSFGLPQLSFGRLRPLHTNAAIFAFAGNAVFAAVYYSSQRLLKARMFSDALSRFHFWGWQAIIVSAALTLPFGITQSKEYAELEWPIDIAIAVVWVTFAVNFFGTIARRRERHIYVAVWFYMATIITVALLHIFNNLAIPAGAFKSYSVYAGVQDAFMQWWYGHNAVAFFLTTPFLGLMYYFLPKAANRPVFSYRLSILHFWSLVFIYIWAGPHHLHYTALPEWASTLGMLFSVMLWMPSWGGMINGLLTLRGAWNRVSDDPVLKFFVVGITFYGMATFEGPMLSIKSVNALSHYTDWTIAHVHSGALGWNGFMSFGMLYWLAPRVFQTKLWSKKLAEAHFWLGTIGILLYIVAIYAAGVTQGLMWRAFDETGRLAYPDFIETVVRLIPMYWVRVIGGLLFVAGVAMALLNVVMTWRTRPATYAEAQEEAPALTPYTGETPALVVPKHSTISNIGHGLRYFVEAHWHRAWERKPLKFSLWVGRGRDRGLAVRDDPELPDPLERAEHRQRQAVYAARAARARHLRERRLLQLPLANGAANPLGDRALRRVLEARRVRLRPPVPMGITPHRPRLAPRRRQVPAPVASAPHGRPALDDAAVDHAVLRLAQLEPARLQRRAKARRRDGDARRALRRRRAQSRTNGARTGTNNRSRARDPGRPARARRKANHRADRLPAAARHGHQVGAAQREAGAHRRHAPIIYRR